MERLHMNNLRDLVFRLRRGETGRQIAVDLHVSRNTVHKYRELAQMHGLLEADLVLPDNKTLLAILGPAHVPPRVESSVEPYRGVVERLLEEGVELAAMLNRLREDHHYPGSYSSLWRFVQHLRPQPVEAYVRVHTAPGEEAQVDFGTVGKLRDVNGVLRTAYGFVMTLSYSRHEYADLVFDQKVPTWIACHRQAFESFGGVPQRVVPDNLKAAVLEASLYDPVLGEAYRRMAQHYDFVISPTRPREPRHKGKVESGVGYLKRNFMAGQDFADIVVAREKLRVWVQETAGTRIHGTTHEPPLRRFLQRERAALRPLPGEPFTLGETRPVRVHEDCHVQIDGSYYSVPWKWVGKPGVDAYIGERVVELFAGVELLATHPRAKQKGEWHTRLEHYPPEKAAYLERTPARCRQIAARLGPATTQVVETLLGEKPLDRLRAVQGILRLEESVGSVRLERACLRALHFGDVRYRRIKDTLNAGLDFEELPGKVVALPPRRYVFARPVQEFLCGAEGGVGEVTKRSLPTDEGQDTPVREGVK
jgi:transposase